MIFRVPHTVFCTFLFSFVGPHFVAQWGGVQQQSEEEEEEGLKLVRHYLTPASYIRVTPRERARGGVFLFPVQSAHHARTE